MDGILKYYYWSGKNFENAGDYFNKILINELYCCECIPVKNNPDVVFCGSLLAHNSISKSKYIIGCGFQNSKPPTNKNSKSYKAVRGRLSGQKLTKCGIELSRNVKFVDPGLMVSMIYPLKDVSKKYKIGIIPHYVDEHLVRKIYGDDYKIISMKTTDIQSICHQIKSCDIILSSSLHGIIFSHSLGIPAYHIELSKLMDGDNFKFKDYYSCYKRGIEYNCFKCEDYNIPFDEILEYDSNNRAKCNPPLDAILIKQREFLSVLPYKELLNEKYRL